MSTSVNKWTPKFAKAVAGAMMELVNGAKGVTASGNISDSVLKNFKIWFKCGEDQFYLEFNQTGLGIRPTGEPRLEAWPLYVGNPISESVLKHINAIIPFAAYDPPVEGTVHYWHLTYEQLKEALAAAKVA